jgi:probable F420-dependent oxidoreductase
MRIGIHLPQYGRAASGDAITKAAKQAEDLGFADVWVSDHLAVPTGASYPPAFLYEPVISLTWAAAATTRIGLGTSVLVLPYRHPLHLAKELASLDLFSGGRLVVGAAAGWLEGEFAALGVPFGERGARADETIDALRACWEQRPVQHDGKFFPLHDLQVRPQPGRRIPIWIGGTSPAALRRAATRGDGWHGNIDRDDKLSDHVDFLREQRPEESFTISTRAQWDGLSERVGDYQRRLDALEAAGVQHIVLGPLQGDLEGWLRSVEALADALIR